ncbi:MAG TPA: SDR family NAD(P)-dependent oxidoreductase [Myxococcota bacterium]|jgi:NAD(P)-dependent dehydrogenase (short-subunit alcohol dehydrogenase family)
MRPSVLLTGASSGIGAATAVHLAGRGFQVFGTSRRPERQSLPGVRFLALDARDEASVAKAVAEVLASAGRLDAVVCNAGVGIFGSVEEVTIEAARELFETNFFGTLRVLRAALPHLREARRGRIVIVGSLAGRAPIPFQAHYSASKGALDALALALHNELHGTGVGISLIEPGDIRTEFNERTEWGEPGLSAYGERLRRAERVIRESLPRAPGPEIVARAIERALTSRRPRVRYTVGPDSLLVPLARRLLPDRWSLRLVRSHFRV